MTTLCGLRFISFTHNKVPFSFYSAAVKAFDVCRADEVEGEGKATQKKVMFNVSEQKSALARFTCRNHAVGMGGGWQAVTGGVVHEDRQG